MCHYNCPDFSLFAPLHSATPTLSGNPPTIVHVHGSFIHIHGSCIHVLWLLHFLYYTLHPHSYSVTTYLYTCLYFLIPSPLHPSHHKPLSSGKHQNVLHIHDSASVLLVCLVCLFFPNILFIFRERGREGERGGEKHQCGCLYAPPFGDLTHNPGMCPDWESN